MSRRDVCKVTGILLVAGITYGMLHRCFYIDRMLKRGAETRLNGEGDPYFLALRGPQFKDRDLTLLKTIPSLERVHLKGSAVTDVGMASLADVDQLVEVDLSGTRITNEAISELSRISSLRTLVLDHCTALSVSGLRKLSALPELRSLSLIGVPLTYRELLQLDQQLAGVTVLMDPNEVLGLTPDDPLRASWRRGAINHDSSYHGENCFTDRGIRLSARSGSSAVVTARFLRSIGASEAVAEIDLAEVSEMEPDAFETLHRFRSLKTLRVWSIADDAALASLARHESLLRLRIDSPHITDQGLLAIPPDRPWVELSITGWNVTGPGLASLRHCPRLRALSLNCPNLNPSSLKAVRLVRNLESFRVADVGLPSESLRLLISQPRLERIEVFERSFPAGLQLAAHSVWEWK
jgi:hypothetical protein